MPVGRRPAGCQAESAVAPSEVTIVTGVSIGGQAPIPVAMFAWAPRWELDDLPERAICLHFGAPQSFAHESRKRRNRFTGHSASLIDDQP